ncbi:heavy metal sensor histidine kinase [uncultured Gilvimarinus sp.]|uniref:heavy metal sensor histidine kinase n=1 Tax=uncultured Gilvimarinus sp. TaxID=1689143 RepID=UPI0030DDA3FA
MKRIKLSKRRPLSLTGRVMIFVAIAIGISLLIIGQLVQNAVKHHFAEQDAAELVVMTNSVRQSLIANDGGTPLSEGLSRAVSGHHGVYFQVWDSQGGLLFGPNNLDTAEPSNSFKPVSSIQANNLYTWVIGNTTYRGAVTNIRLKGSSYRIVAAIDMNFHIQFLENFRHSLWLIMALAGGITLLAAWYGIHQGHAPLRGLSGTMSDVQADRLHVRVDPSTVPSELQKLVVSFNGMIERLEDSFSRLSHFSADIAHELRTPLTNLITQTQVALSKPRSLDVYLELLYSNLEEQERLAKMVNDMLWLAHSDHGLLRLVKEEVDLKQEVLDLYDFFGALSEEKHVRLVLAGTAPSIQGDRAMLRRALSNLLSNAIRHTPAGEKILVELSALKNGGALLNIKNSGPEIPAEHLSKIFDRFHRVDPSRARHSDGAGLGLAIVKSIIESHGGEVDVSSDSGVTCFKLALFNHT